MITSTTPALAVFTYNRLIHAKRTIEKLQQNTIATSMPLYVFSDGPKSPEDAPIIQELRDYLAGINGFNSVLVIESEENQGLAQSIINGITWILSQYQSAIIIEDDILTSPVTLEYFSYLLEKYETDKKVFSISANCETPRSFKVHDQYEYDVFFTFRMMCWGWATWRDRWQLCDWSVSDLESFLETKNNIVAYENHIGADSLRRLIKWSSGSLDVWACRWIYAHYKNNAYCAVPLKTLTINIGRDGTGQHSGIAPSISVDLDTTVSIPPKLPERPFIDNELVSSFIQSFQSHENMFTLLLRASRKLLKKIINISDDIILGNPKKHELIFYGTKYGGWLLPEGALNEKSIVISAGAGEDISFDFEIARKFGCTVHIFDPTPRAINHFEETKRLLNAQKNAPINHSIQDSYPSDPSILSRLKYLPYGIWSKNIIQRFYMPIINSHVSHSIVTRHNKDGYFEAECLRVTTILERFSYSQLDLLKMDIEGAEYAVLYDMFRTKIRPKYLLVEFHNNKFKLDKILKPRTIIYSLLIRILGYRLLARDNMDFVFVRVKN